MMNPKLRGIIFTTAAAAIVAGCGADEIASPGAGSVTINNTTNNPAPPPPPPPVVSTLATPAGACPTIADPQGLANDGTISGPTGEYRICTLPSRINVSSTLVRRAGVLYRMNGRVDVGTDQGAASTNNVVTLGIEPGVVVFATSGPSFLNVNRGNRLMASGTAALPIVFTSTDNVAGFNNDDSSGQWGGVVLNGRAPVTDCEAPAAAPGTVACERLVEGAATPTRFGGAQGADNSGTMRNVQIRFSGFVLGNNIELQSLTTGGVGSGTTLENIQSFNSSDDGIELFGGNVNIRNLAVVGAEDDSIDTDTGVKANMQYVIAVQRAQTTPNGDSIIEADSNGREDNLPRQNTRISNFTFVQRAAAANTAAVFIRGSADYALVNGVLVSPGIGCIRLNSAQTASATANTAIDEVGAPIFRSFVAQCGTTPFLGTSGVTNDQVAAIFGTGTNNNNSGFTPTLTAMFVNGSSETAVPVFNATTLNSFFEATTYIGAIRDANDTRFQGWTCNSATVNFGGAGTACTSLPRIIT